MKPTVCPGCNLEFIPETKPRSTTGRCSQCNHELPAVWRWKRCEGCNEHERMRIAKYRANRKEKLTKQTQTPKPTSPWIEEDKKLFSGAEDINKLFTGKNKKEDNVTFWTP